MNTTWLVIANETNANIYKINKKEFELIDNLKHPESRLTDHELVSDRPGHYRTPDTAHGAYVPDSDPHELEKVIFARTIARFLEHERSTEKFQHLIICASPHFYGLLKNELSSHVSNIIKNHYLKDYIVLETNELNKFIKDIQEENIF